MNTETKQCQNCKQDYTIEPEDFDFYIKMGVETPPLCPLCRFKRRAQFRNEINLYSGKCGLCGKSIISMYNPDSSFVVYCYDCFHSDKWDPLQYHLDYDPSKPFFDQFSRLMKMAPRPAIMSDNIGVNSDYIDFAGENKNCYFIFNSSHNEDCLYSRGINKNKETADAYFCDQLENSYESINANHSHKVTFAENSSGDVDCCFTQNTSGCNRCFGTVNERNKSNLFFGEPLSPEEYSQRINAIRGSYSEMESYKKKFEEFSLTFPKKEHQNLKTMTSTGNYLFESKNLKNCFEYLSCENLKNCHFVKLAKDCRDCLGFSIQSELLLECVAVGYSQNVIGSFSISHSQNIRYSTDLKTCSFCFGCIGLKNREHMILNTQYSPEEYEAIKEKIIKELKADGSYGLFFPPSLAPFAYNESIAQENFPLTKEEASSQGFRWEDNMQFTTGKETITSDNIPDNIRDVDDAITKEILKCVSCGRNYRIVPTELELYKKLVLPLPRRCFYCRYRDRIQRRGPMVLFDRKCDKCKKDIQTNYSPDRPEIVYCEQCYNAEVV